MSRARAGRRFAERHGSRSPAGGRLPAPCDPVGRRLPTSNYRAQRPHHQSVCAMEASRTLAAAQGSASPGWRCAGSPAMRGARRWPGWRRGLRRRLLPRRQTLTTGSAPSPPTTPHPQRGFADLWRGGNADGGRAQRAEGPEHGASTRAAGAARFQLRGGAAFAASGFCAMLPPPGCCCRRMARFRDSRRRRRSTAHQCPSISLGLRSPAASSPRRWRRSSPDGGRGRPLPARLETSLRHARRGEAVGLLDPRCDLARVGAGAAISLALLLYAYAASLTDAALEADRRGSPASAVDGARRARAWRSERGALAAFAPLPGRLGRGAGFVDG